MEEELALATLDPALIIYLLPCSMDKSLDPGVEMLPHDDCLKISCKAKAPGPG